VAQNCCRPRGSLTRESRTYARPRSCTAWTAVVVRPFVEQTLCYTYAQKGARNQSNDEHCSGDPQVREEIIYNLCSHTSVVVVIVPHSRDCCGNRKIKLCKSSITSMYLTTYCHGANTRVQTAQQSGAALRVRFLGLHETCLVRLNKLSHGAAFFCCLFQSLW